MKKIWIGIVKLCGWKFVIPDQNERPEVQRCVVAMAPHTCIADFFIGAAVMMAAGVNMRIFMKKEFFNKFSTPILTHFGVIPVDRGNTKNHLVDRAVEEFANNERLSIAITPEGTRKPVKRFKRGFYEIAMKANVPIILTFIDFKEKRAGYGPTFYPTGDYEADFAKMIEFFAPIHPKNPQGWYFGK